MRIAPSLHSPTHHLLFLIVAFFSITTQKLVISIFPVPEHTFLWLFLVPLSLLPYGTQDPMIPLLRFKRAWALPESQPTRLLPSFPSRRHIPEQCLKKFQGVDHLNIYLPICASTCTMTWMFIHDGFWKRKLRVKRSLVPSFSSATSEGQLGQCPRVPAPKSFCLSLFLLLHLSQNFFTHKNGYALGPYFLLVKNSTANLSLEA